MIDLMSTGEGVILPILAQPKARQNAVTGLHAGCLKVSVTEAPDKGKANKAIVKLLAAALELKKTQLVLVAGETSQRKKCLVRDITADDLGNRIDKVIEQDH